MDVVEVYRGSLNSAQVRVAEVFRAAIRRNAAAFIICHNHPSGVAEPSPDDIALTRAVVLAGKLLDLELVDHLIVGRGRFVSLKERNLGFDTGARVSDSQRNYRVHEPFPGDLIYAYSRAQALADGVLVDVSHMALEAGFRFPTAITADLHTRLAPNEAEARLGQSYDGRLWDVLWMAANAARRAARHGQGDLDRVSFRVLLAEAMREHPGRLAYATLDLWLVCGPGDDAGPVLTIGFPADF
jgi:hypothetical protein